MHEIDDLLLFSKQVSGGCPVGIFDLRSPGERNFVPYLDIPTTATLKTRGKLSIVLMTHGPF